ncbi:MAG: hypothetical protein M1409_00390 [Actinobacteria bacterium]|nr:hypothetical protein [Actinomycetota bacterium]MCL5674203.1 hypothetical protein [Candidatus Omnitrophota bacterium]
MAKILISPLSWGLGHASRIVPIAKEFLRRGHAVTFATSGRALIFLHNEFPQCETIEFKDYPAPFTSTPFFAAKFALYIPAMLKAIQGEKKETDRILSQKKFDLIISDARFGVYSKDIPSFFINHQLRFRAPLFFKPVDLWSEYFHTYFHTNFQRVIIPDNPPGEASLLGSLDVSNQPATNKIAYYCGILAAAEKIDIREDIDYLITISTPGGPNYLENKILKQICSLSGKKTILLARPEENFEYELFPGTIVKSYASRKEMNVLMNRSKFIITRGGYTTIMEIAELDKQSAMLIPIPGHTEQQYIARYLRKQKWIYSTNQYKLNLTEDIKKAMQYKGLPKMTKTRENVKKLYNEVFAQCL